MHHDCCAPFLTATAQSKHVFLDLVRWHWHVHAQGLLKGEGRARFGEAYLAWQRRAAEFELDGHAPVR